MNSTLTSLRDHVVAAAAIAAASRPTTIEEKGRHDFVTDLDRHIENALHEPLSRLFGVPVLGEESVGDDERLPNAAVVVDPLDGTGNWIAGFPFAAVSVAYVESGKSVMAAVAAIGSDAVFTAEAGVGAWRNGERLMSWRLPPQSLFSLSTGLLDAIDGSDAFARLRAFGKVRNFGSQALQLCAVAQGALAFNASIEARLWDDAAGRLIALEAGMRYRAAPSDILSSKQHSLCVHPAVADEVEAILGLYLDPARNFA